MTLFGNGRFCFVLLFYLVDRHKALSVIEIIKECSILCGKW